MNTLFTLALSVILVTAFTIVFQVYKFTEDKRQVINHDIHVVGEMHALKATSIALYSEITSFAPDNQRIEMYIALLNRQHKTVEQLASPEYRERLNAALERVNAVGEGNLFQTNTDVVQSYTLTVREIHDGTRLEVEDAIVLFLAKFNSVLAGIVLFVLLILIAFASKIQSATGTVNRRKEDR